MTEIRAARAPIPRTVLILGLVSLCMDISSEMIHALLPLFLTTTLGASVAIVGLIEGLGEATASIVKVFSGYWSDRIGKRKPFILIGYGLGAVSKPFFALASDPMMVLAARFADRVGKGMRAAPRDALVADITPDAVRGGAYGLRQALDTAGAFIGPLTAIGLMALFADNMRTVFWLAIIPGAVAVLLVVMGVEDRAAGPEKTHARPPIRLADLRRLEPAFWGVVGVGVVFALARFSEAFLVLKASAEGLPLALAPLVYVVMNAVFSFGSYPAGLWSDRAPPALPLLCGLAALIAADLVFVLVTGLPGAFVGIALWGLYLALTQGLLAKLVADYAPPDLRGSAFGIFNLATGVATLAASTVAGLVWTQIDSNATFLVGAGLAAAAGILIIVLARRSFDKAG